MNEYIATQWDMKRRLHGGEQDNNLQMDNRVLRQLNVKLFFMMYGAS
jgi:hypothetical protein